jgi:hypothetical protein
MKNNKWRTVQIFLEPTNLNIYEVEISQESENNIRCNCRTFSSTKACKHSRFVQNHMKKNDGHYSIQISKSIPDEDVLAAMEDAETFRKFIIANAKIEVIH